jgi:Flp pilus assembly protein TadG
MMDGRKISFNKRGVVVILLALGMLVLVLAFASLGIDIAYMYNVKNDLQVSSDAAALAGADLITNVSDLTQSAARTGAIDYAAKNKTAGKPVVLASDGSNTLSSSNDITVGFWDGKSGTYTAGMTPVNAIEVRPRRTAGSPGGPVSVFWGGAMRLIASDWTHMSAASEAIAYRQVMKPTLPIAIDQDSNCGEVISCPGPMSVTFNPDGSDSGAWTTYYSSPSAATIKDLIQHPENNPDVCASPNPIHLNNGTVDSALKELGDDITNLFGGYPFKATIVQIANPSCKFNQTRPVLGLVAITITDVVSTGGNKHITATVDGCYSCDELASGGTAKLVR